MNQKFIPLESRVEWQNALQGIKHAFAHTWENCYAMHLTTGFTTYLYCFEAENIRIVCPIAEREFQGYVDIVTPYGLSKSNDEKALSPVCTIRKSGIGGSLSITEAMFVATLD